MVTGENLRPMAACQISFMTLRFAAVSPWIYRCVVASEVESPSHPGNRGDRVPGPRHVQHRCDVLDAVGKAFYWDRPGPDELERVFTYFPRLKERVQQQAGTLSGGEQQMLAIARALMLKPRLMLLDEPSFGLAPLIVVEIFRILRLINKEEGVSILLVEQNAALALELADTAYVLETGRVVMSGPSSVVKNDENVRKSYLGY